MWKIIGGVLIGVFVGVVTLEIVKRKRPDLIRDIERRAEESARSFVKAFKDGYQGKQREVGEASTDSKASA